MNMLERQSWLHSKILYKKLPVKFMMMSMNSKLKKSSIILMIPYLLMEGLIYRKQFYKLQGRD